MKKYDVENAHESEVRVINEAQDARLPASERSQSRFLRKILRVPMQMTGGSRPIPYRKASLPSTLLKVTRHFCECSGMKIDRFEMLP